jgi:hypothetical protein
METKTILLLVICGIVIALLSALYSVDKTGGLVGATTIGYGLPMLWLKKVTYVVPGATDNYSLYDSGLWLLVDIVFWIVIVAIIYFAYKMVKKE